MVYITSSYTMSVFLRNSIANLQSDLARSQKELTTGRHADMSASLGADARRSVTLANAQETIDAYKISNQVAATRLTSTQTTLDALVSSAKSLRSTLIAAQDGTGQRDALLLQARQALADFTGKINASNGEAFLFAGLKTDDVPVADFFAEPPEANRQALDGAFLTAFGFDQSQPNVASITKTQMTDFLNGGFASLFSDASWRADWSRATDEPIASRIGAGLVINSAITANEPGLKELAAAYTMIIGVGAENLSPEAYGAMASKASERVDAAISLLTKTQARLGVTQSRIAALDDAMAVQMDTLDAQRHAIEGVDKTASAARVNALMTQIETAYTLTSRLSQLTLAKYL